MRLKARTVAGGGAMAVKSACSSHPLYITFILILRDGREGATLSSCICLDASETHKFLVTVALCQKSANIFSEACQNVSLSTLSVKSIIH